MAEQSEDEPTVELSLTQSEMATGMPLKYSTTSPSLPPPMSRLVPAARARPTIFLLERRLIRSRSGLPPLTRSMSLSRLPRDRVAPLAPEPRWLPRRQVQTTVLSLTVAPSTVGQVGAEPPDVPAVVHS